MPVREKLPLFPLANVALFPRVQTPLHVFEPRYRQMTEHALAGDRRIGMVVVRPEHLERMAEDPPVFEVGCEGAITNAQQLPDGRFYIVLQGTQRFRIVRESAREAGRLYRVAEIDKLEDTFDPVAVPRVIALRERAIELAAELTGAQSSRPALTPGAFRNIDDETFVNALSNAFALAAAEKQSLLEAASIPERYERLVSILGFQAAERRHLAALPSSAIH
jgi:Lon protease-like protein